MVKDGGSLARANLDWSKGGNATVSADAASGIPRCGISGAAAIMIVYRLYGER